MVPAENESVENPFECKTPEEREAVWQKILQGRKPISRDEAIARMRGRPPAPPTPAEQQVRLAALREWITDRKPLLSVKGIAVRAGLADPFQLSKALDGRPLPLESLEAVEEVLRTKFGYRRPTASQADWESGTDLANAAQI